MAGSGLWRATSATKASVAQSIRHQLGPVGIQRGAAKERFSGSAVSPVTWTAPHMRQRRVGRMRYQSREADLLGQIQRAVLLAAKQRPSGRTRRPMAGSMAPWWSNTLG